MSVRTERDTLMGFLEAQRSSVLAILEGLDEQAVHREMVPSGWTPVGMIRHLAMAERFWFQEVLTGGTSATSLAAGPPVPGVACDSHEALRFYREQAALSDRQLSAAPLDEPPLGDVPSDLFDEITDVRALILHMIEETARHAGHLDIARELIDGRTGLGAR